MGITEGESKELSLRGDAVTDTHQFLLCLEALGDTLDHIVYECAVETVHRAVTRLVRRTLELDFIVLNGDLDVRINLLAEFTERSFNLQHVARENFDAHLVRKAYR